MFNSPLRLFLVLALSATLAACGFKLRANAELPFTTLHNGMKAGTELSDEFNRQARISSTTTLVANRSRAQASLEMIKETREKEAVSFSPSGRPREFLLRYRVNFRVRDKSGVEVLEPTEILLRRYITTTDIEVLSAELEEDFLYKEMQKDMAQQIIRRLSVLKIP